MARAAAGAAIAAASARAAEQPLELLPKPLAALVVEATAAGPGHLAQRRADIVAAHPLDLLLTEDRRQRVEGRELLGLLLAGLARRRTAVGRRLDGGWRRCRGAAAGTSGRGEAAAIAAAAGIEIASALERRHR
jgi:hypothetical protein